MVDAKAKLTYEDYRKTPDDERWELLNGDLVMAPSPKLPTRRLPATCSFC